MVIFRSITNINTAHTLTMTATTTRSSTITSMLFAWLLLLSAPLVTTAQEDETCAWNDLSCYQDPHLKKIQVDLGTGTNATFLAYHPPDVSTFYQEAPGTREAMKPGFRGQFGKFINLSPNKVRIYWYVRWVRYFVILLDAIARPNAGAKSL
jgi:hypothetical protein